MNKYVVRSTRTNLSTHPLLPNNYAPQFSVPNCYKKVKNFKENIQLSKILHRFESTKYKDI